MNKILRKNQGYTGVDISISIIIMLIFIPTIFGMVYNIQKSNAETKRKSNAINFGTDVLEVAKVEDYSEISLDGKFKTDLDAKYRSSNYKNTETEEADTTYFYYQARDENDEHYQIQVGIKNYYPNDNDNEDVIKQIKVRVFYSSGDDIKNVDISMVKKNE